MFQKIFLFTSFVITILGSPALSNVAKEVTTRSDKKGETIYKGRLAGRAAVAFCDKINVTLVGAFGTNIIVGAGATRNDLLGITGFWSGRCLEIKAATTTTIKRKRIIKNNGFFMVLRDTCLPFEDNKAHP